MCRPAASLLSPGVRVTVSPHEAVKNCVLVSHGLCILGHKHHRLSELDVLGDHVSCESPLSWGPRCGIRTFVPQGRAGSLSSLPAVCYHHRGRLMVTLCLSPSYCFHVGFLICLLWRSHATHFWISFCENCLICCCGFSVSLAGDDSRNLPCDLLELNSPNLWNFKKKFKHSHVSYFLELMLNL